MKRIFRRVIMGALFLTWLSHASDPLDTWTLHDLGFRGTTNDHNFYGVSYGNDLFVAVGDQTILASRDANSWNRVFSGRTSFLKSAVYGNGQFVAVGETNAISISTNGFNWKSSSSGGNNHFEGIAYGNDLFVVVGFYRSNFESSTDPGSGLTFVSTDGIRGSIVGLRDYSILSGVTYDHGLFVAVGHDVFGGTIFTSTNGTTWSKSKLGTNIFALSAISSSSDMFVAVGYPGAILTSVDGKNWTSHSSGTFVPLTAVTYGNGVFVATGWGGTILTSLDGRNWTRRNSGTTERLNGITYGNGQFIAVGDHGTIVESQPIVRLAPTALLANGDVQFKLNGQSGQTYAIQASTNLADWVDLTNVVLTGETGQFSDSSATNFSQRFYRALVP